MSELWATIAMGEDKVSITSSPIRVRINLWNTIKLWFMVIISFLLWIILLFASFHILICYIHSIFVNGFFDDEKTIKYAAMLVIGAYFFLILDKNKIFDALNIKRDLPFITVEQAGEEEINRST